MTDFYEKLKNFRNENNNFATYNNAKIVEIKEGYGVAKMKITGDSMNPVGSVHGAALFLVADIACGGAASSYGMMVTTANMDIHFMRAGINTTEITATANVVKRGKKLIIISFTVTDHDGTELCMGTATFASLGIKVPQKD